MEIIALVHTDFPTKFGLPRQAGLADALRGTIVFEPAYRNPDCLRGLEQWSHIWLIWQFDRAADAGWSPTVLPPKLGGKTRVGVFATRSPFRPNSLGLSAVRLESVELHTKNGPVLHIAGADMVDGTPIYDIKPYVPYADCYPEAVDAFAGKRDEKPLKVVFPQELLRQIPPDRQAGLIQALSFNPRPGYHHDPDRKYGFYFLDTDVRFQIDGDTLRVVELERLPLSNPPASGSVPAAEPSARQDGDPSHSGSR